MNNIQQHIIKKVWIYVFLGILLTKKNYSVKFIKTKLYETLAKHKIKIKIKFNHKSIKTLSTFIKSIKPYKKKPPRMTCVFEGMVTVFVIRQTSGFTKVFTYFHINHIFYPIITQEMLSSTNIKKIKMDAGYKKMAKFLKDYLPDDPVKAQTILNHILKMLDEWTGCVKEEI